VSEKEIVSSYTLSPMQQGMLMRGLHESGTYVQQLVCDLRENVNVPALHGAWQEVVKCHDVLRTAFRWEGIPEPVQDVYGNIEVVWRNYDWSNLEPARQDQGLDEFLLNDRSKAFEVTKPLLTRWACFKLSDKHYRLVWTFHHALLDGRSHFMVLQEVFSLYEARLRDVAPTLPARRPYRDYIQWLSQVESSEARTFWTQYLRGYTPPPALRLRDDDFLESNEDKHRQPAYQRRTLPGELTSALKLTAKQNEITLNTLVQGSWALLLGHYYASQDIVFGATRACRHGSISGSESIIGLLINTLPLRVDVDPQQPLREWLRDLRRQQLAFRDYEHTPLAKIQQWSGIPRGASLFESIFVFESYELNEQLNSSGRDFDLREQTEFPLALAVYSGSQLALKLEYDERRFDAAAIQGMLGHLENLLTAMAADLNLRLGQLPLLSEAERQQVLFDWNPAPERRLSQDCLHQLFSEQVKRTPEATAVVFEEERLSFAELEDRSTDLAHHLEKLGVGPEVLVGICVERSIEMVVGILGIIKAGGAYLPLDPAYPTARLSFMLEDSGAGMILTEPALRDRFSSQLPVICLEKNRTLHNLQHSPHELNTAAAVTPLNLAYVIYTSGSTGQPKGVMVTHENVIRLFETTQSLFGFDHTDVWTLFHSYAFDFSIWEMWGALLYGGLLVVVPYWISRAPRNFYRLLRAAGVTVLNQTPSAFRQFVEAEAEDRKNCSKDDTSLRFVILGGEALDGSIAKRWFKNHNEKKPQLVNMYGITETTVHVTHHPVTQTGSSGQRAIGRPLPDLQVYILDSQMAPVPVGVSGEIYVGGAGLSRGYLKRPDLTAERFLPHPFSEKLGARLYRTGDVARFLRDGTIEYLGRSDTQVKLRGFRIEVGEVEKCLANHPGIVDCVVVVRVDQPGLKQLVAYVVTTSDQIATNELRSYLIGKLPEHMVPAVFMRLDHLPLTENGKLDRSALPAPLDDNATATFVGPRNGTEETIASIWREVLWRKTVGVFEDFFELGGDSLLATQVLVRIREMFNVNMPLQYFFDNSTVAGQAEFLRGAKRPDQKIMPEIRRLPRG